MNNKKNNSCEYNPKKVLTQREAMEQPVGSFYHPTEKTYRSGACPPGQNLRRGYKRKAYTKENGTRVPETYVNAVCIENKGLPGKVLNKYRVIKINQEDLLKQFGYSTRLSSDKRFEVLLKAASKLSYRSVVARINAIRILSRSNKHLYKIYTEDLKNLRKWRNENPELYKNKNVNKKVNQNINTNNIIIKKEKNISLSNNSSKVVSSNNLSRVVSPSNNLSRVITPSSNNKSTNIKK
jgi:glycosyltransferase involved in cell wall biosynthesis